MRNPRLWLIKKLTPGNTASKKEPRSEPIPPGSRAQALNLHVKKITLRLSLVLPMVGATAMVGKFNEFIYKQATEQGPSFTNRRWQLL